jgi:hypothetical protein
MNAHPDESLARRVRAAIDHWLATPHPYGPTSQVTGGGAIAAAEHWIGQRHGGRRALLLPSATYGLRVALQMLGVRPGDEVLLPAIDWPSSRAAVLSLGAVPRPVPVDEATLTIDPRAARARRTRATRAAVVCHLHGVPADVPDLRRELPDLPLVEDCAQAWGATLDGAPVGTFAEAAVFSFGPGKTIDAGEAGVLLVDGDEAYRAATRLAAHPVRQLLAGLSDPDPTQLSLRPHPVAAMLALHALSAWRPEDARAAADRAARAVAARPGFTVVGAGRPLAGPAVPVLVADGAVAPDRITLRPSGAGPLPGVVDRRTVRLAGRIRLARCAGTLGDHGQPSPRSDRGGVSDARWL